MRKTFFILLLVLLSSSLLINFSQKLAWKKEAEQQNKVAFSLSKTANRELEKTNRDLEREIVRLKKDLDLQISKNNQVRDEMLALKFSLTQKDREIEFLKKRIREASWKKR